MILLSWFPNLMTAWLFVFLLMLWILVEGGNQVWGRRGRLTERPQAGDKHSYELLLLVGGVSFGLAWLGRSFNVAVFVGLGQYLGLSLMLGGLVLRQWAILVLGRHFSTTVSLEADHRLVQHGPYRFLRHPAYTGSFMTMVGLQVALGNLGSTVLVIIILLGALMYRIKIEEEHLLTTFGEQYQRYMRRTWRLWPGL